MGPAGVGGRGSGRGSRGSSDRLGELALLFLKLGFIAFGGPAAHIAMMEDEVVTRRRWMRREHFLDLIGATNLIPGPNSTEIALHVGIERAGWRGLAMAGACFIGPAVAMTAAFAWLYVRYGRLPAVEPYLDGIKPAVIAVILAAVWKLGRTAVKGWRLGVLGAAATALSLGPASEIVALAACGLAGMLWLHWSGTPPPRAACLAAVPLIAPALTTVAGTGAAAGASLWKLGLFFLKIGAILFGSGYVLVAFLQGGLVDTYGWLTQRQLLDAVALGQLTPGPVLSTATFIGYLIAGWPGAAVATLGIFLPSFLFVVILNPLVPRLRESAWTAAFLDAVNVAAVGLMAAVTIQLGAAILTSWPAWTIAIAAAVAALFFRVNAAWLVLGGGVAGRLLEMLRG